MSYKLPQDDDLQSFLSVPAPAHDWVIEGLEPGDVGILSAPGGTGKSMFCLSLAASVSAGEPLFGAWKVSAPGDVLYLYAEDSSHTLHRRLYALHQINPLRSLTRMHTVCVRTAPPTLMVRSRYSAVAERVEETIQEIIARISSYPRPRLLILDPLIKFHALEENNNAEMAQLLSMLSWLADQLHIAIVLTHHVGKGAVFSGNGNTQQSARGATSIVDQSRWQVSLSTIDAKTANTLKIPEEDAWRYVYATCPKINGTAKLPDLLLERGPGGVLMRSALIISPVNRGNRRVVSIDDYMGGSNQ